MRLFMIWIGVVTRQGLGVTRTGMQRLGKMRMRIGRPGTRDGKRTRLYCKIYKRRFIYCD
jgi:hypothetical protein